MDLKNKHHKFTLYNGLLSMYKGEVYSTFHRIPSTKKVKHRITGNYKSLNKKYYNI